MNSTFFYGYVAAGIGLVISMFYFGLYTFCQQRNLRFALQSASFQQFFERRRHQMILHKYRNRHRTKMITRRLMHKINQLGPRVHLLSDVPRWKLIYTPTGDVRAIPLPH